MRPLLIAFVLTAWAASGFAQDKPPLPATDVTAKDLSAFIDSFAKDVITDRAIKVAEVGGYRVGIFGVFRPKALAGDAILHETKTSEVYYMLEGAGTLVTGGAIKDLKPDAKGVTSPTRGLRIEGGVTRRVTVGDIIVIPGRTPHWWSQLESDIRYLIIRPDPENRLTVRP
jgi:mannose-6-phosphate isomerase-like protein (cupin superfamily)